jgi:hypothetical protein
VHRIGNTGYRDADFCDGVASCDEAFNVSYSSASEAYM